MISFPRTLVFTFILPISNVISSGATTKIDMPKNDGLVTLPVLPHEHVLRRHLSERRDLDEVDPLSTEQITALYQGYGTHYVDLWVGSPRPQRQTVIVDTGSQITAFPCVDCADCGESYHTDRYFNYKKSESFEKVACTDCILGHCYTNKPEDECSMGLSYQEGSSWKAFESVDMAYAGGLHDAPVQGASTVPTSEKENPFGLTGGQMPQGASDYGFNLNFGCENVVTGLFKTQLADGIMGMSNDKGAFWKQMYEAGIIDNQQFSLCFRRESDADKKGTGAGAMTLGGTNPIFHDSPMVYAKNTQNRGFYNVEVKAMYLRTDGGLVPWGEDDEIIKLDIDKTSLNTGRVIVDSGTTDTYFNRKVMEPFKKEWKSVTGFDYKNDGLKLTDEQLERLPTILVQLTGDDVNFEIAEVLNVPPEEVPGLAAIVDPENPYDVLVAITPMQYMEYDPDDKSYSSRFYIDERSGSVLGANTMQSHDVFFDIENARIGWAESDCEYMAITGQEHFVMEKEEIEDEKGESSPASAGSPFTFDEPDDGKFCSSRFCKSASVLGLLLVVFQGVVAWRCFRSADSRQYVRTEGTDSVLNGFDKDIDEDELTPDRNELL